MMEIMMIAAMRRARMRMMTAVMIIVMAMMMVMMMVMNEKPSELLEPEKFARATARIHP